MSAAEGTGSGTTPLTFTVTRSGANDVASTVAYTTTPGTATAGRYLPRRLRLRDHVRHGDVPGRGQHAADHRQRLQDTLFEANEAFTVTLSSPTNATISDGTGTGTIRTTTPRRRCRSTTSAAAEGSPGTTTFTFTVTQSAVSGLATTVNFATAAGTATGGATCPGTVDYITIRDPDGRGRLDDGHDQRDRLP